MNIHHSYDRLLIRSIVIVAYLGWAIYASLYVFRPRPGTGSHTILMMTVLLAFWTVFAIQRSPWTFYVYVAFPCYFWNQVITHTAKPLMAWFRGSPKSCRIYAKRLFQAVLVVGVLQSMVVRGIRWRSYLHAADNTQVAYTHRWIWSIGFALIGVAWPLLFWPKRAILQNPRMSLAWMVLCLVTAKFPLLNVDKKEDLQTMWVTASLFFSTYLIEYNRVACWGAEESYCLGLFTPSPSFGKSPVWSSHSPSK